MTPFFIQGHKSPKEFCWISVKINQNCPQTLLKTVKLYTSYSTHDLVFFRYSYKGVLKLICVQILLILIAWILVSVALKK